MDPFRYCVYCGADCYEDEPQHTDGCPSRTDVFPAEPDDDMVCMDCGAPFGPGDFYTHRWGEPLDGTPCGDVICLGCAAHAELLAAS
jgi:hypothetical protein